MIQDEVFCYVCNAWQKIVDYWLPFNGTYTYKLKCGHTQEGR